MARLRYNGLSTTLGASLTNSATSVTFAAALTHAGGTNVPTIASPDYLPLAILDSTGKLSEVVYLTAYTSAGTTGTISRGQEGTSGVAHSSGDKVLNGPLVNDLPRDRLWLPAAASSSIDEFNDDSLDAAWTRVDGTGAASGNVTYTESADVLSVYNDGGDTATCIHGLVRPLTGAGGSLSNGDGFVVGCTPFHSTSDAAFAMGGVVLSDGNTFGAGNQVVGLIYRSTVHDRGLRAFTSWNTNPTTVDDVQVGHPFRFLRLSLISANTWRFDFSPDGVSWIKGAATLSKTMTATHVGFISSSWGTSTKSVIGYEFIRRVSGVT